MRASGNLLDYDRKGGWKRSEVASQVFNELSKIIKRKKSFFNLQCDAIYKHSPCKSHFTKDPSNLLLLSVIKYTNEEGGIRWEMLISNSNSSEGCDHECGNLKHFCLDLSSRSGLL